MNVNRYRKIIHSYALIFRYHFFDELILLPGYLLSYTLDVEAGLFNCAMNCNLEPEQVSKALAQIESYFILRQKLPNISIEPSTKPDTLTSILEERGYKYNPKENCVLWAHKLPLATNKLPRAYAHVTSSQAVLRTAGYYIATLRAPFGRKLTSPR